MIRIRRLLFAGAVLCQLAAPAWMILQREWTLRDGVGVKFKVEPLDPKDAVLGRHVRFRIPASEVVLDEAVDRPSMVRSYAVVEMDGEGFGHFGAFREEPPETGVYLGVWVRRSGKKGAIEAPFDRFYLPEDLAPEAGKAAWDAGGSGKEEAHVLLRVHEGFGVVENLYVGDIPVLDYLKAHRELKPEPGDTP